MRGWPFGLRVVSDLELPAFPLRPARAHRRVLLAVTAGEHEAQKGQEGRAEQALGGVDENGLDCHGLVERE